MSLTKEQAKHMFCAWGILSICESNGKTWDMPDGELASAELLAQIIVEQYPDRVDDDWATRTIITSFNDHDDTTWADVERMFQKAEVAWDEKNL